MSKKSTRKDQEQMAMVQKYKELDLILPKFHTDLCGFL
jgi:hypothetical protein